MPIQEQSEDKKQANFLYLINKKLRTLINSMKVDLFGLQRVKARLQRSGSEKLAAAGVLGGWRASEGSSRGQGVKAVAGRRSDGDGANENACSSKFHFTSLSFFHKIDFFFF